MNSDNFFKEYWKNEDVNEYVRQSEIKHAEEKAKKEGFDNGKIVGYTDGFDT